MAKQTATKKTSRRKTARRKKSADAETATVTTETSASSAPTDSPPAETMATPEKKPPRRAGKRTAAGPDKARKGRKGKTDTTRETTAGATAASIEETDGEVIIRFPPAAPPPFVMTPPPPPPKAAPHRAPEPIPAPPPVAKPKTEPVAQPFAKPVETANEEWGTPVVEPPAPPRESRPRPTPQPASSAAESESRMSASKRRRMRRKRHRPDDRKPEADLQPARAPAEPELEPEPETEEPPADLDEDFTVVDWPDTTDVVDAEILAEPPAEVEAEEPAEKTAAEAPRERDRRRRGRRGRRGRREEAEEAHPKSKAAAVEERTPAKKSRREMIINAIPREECRIAILDNSKLEEIYTERATAENHVGNIYKGIVTNVEPSIQAAFVDFGQGKNGFLHVSDLHPKYFPDGGPTENVGHKMPRRHRPPIQKCLRRGQEVIVQVTKEGIGTKGPTLSTYLSIPGRFLVMMPGMARLGVSRRIEDDDSRDKLRELLAKLEMPEGMGFIARTAAMDREVKELQSDLTYLTRLWRAVENRNKRDPAPAELYRESDLVIRTIRDAYADDIERIIVDDPEVAERAREFLALFSPRSDDIVVAYDRPEPIFHKYGIEAELERLHSRRVPLKSGGSLVIDQTEALVAIDVNSGRFRTEDDAEATAYKINLEAADEISRQLRLRDLGGVVVCDFIDMRHESHRRDIERRLARNLKEHKERAKVLRTSQFGIIELTRQRQRASLMRSIYQDCRHCRGTGLVKTVESVSLDVMRLIQLAVTRENIYQIEVVVSPEVSFLLQNRKRALLHDLETKNRRVISLRPDPNFSLDQMEIRCSDTRGRIVPYA